MALWTEIKALWRYRFQTPLDMKQLVFYAEYEGSYPVFEGILNELCESHNQSCCYITSDLEDSTLQLNSPHIQVLYLKILLPFFMAFTKCKVMVLTLAGFNKHDLKRSINDTHYIYVFHAAHGCNATYEFGAFEHYESILCVGPHQVQELKKQEKLYNFKPKQLIEAGYYRIERIYEGYQKYHSQHPGGKNTQETVMFAPTWEDNYVLETYAEAIVKSLRGAGYELIVRLHPETTRRYSDWVNQFEAAHQSDNGIFLERNISTDTSFYKADLLITDWSGMTPEYAYGTERPILFLDGVPQKINNIRYKELEIEPIEVSMRNTLGQIVPANEIPKIAVHTANLLNRQDEYRKTIREQRTQNIFAFGRSSEVGAQHIIDILQGKTPK